MNKDILNEINAAMSSGMPCNPGAPSVQGGAGAPGASGGAGAPGASSAPGSADASGGPGGPGSSGTSGGPGISGAPTAPGGQGAPGVPGGSDASGGRPSATGGAFRRLGLADAPVAIFIYGTNNLPTDSYDCGLATEAMSVAALSLGYGTKILSLPSIVLNGPKKAYFDELLQVPKGYSNIAILLIGRNDESIDATTSASKRYTIDQKVRFID